MINMPMDTSPLAKAMVPNDTSHLGAMKPASNKAASAANVMATSRAGEVFCKKIGGGEDDVTGTCDAVGEVGACMIAYLNLTKFT